MLFINVFKSSPQAKEYFDKELTAGNYYMDETPCKGTWMGKGAELLGLSGEVSKEDFYSLCDNIHPVSGENLTARTIDKRRVYYDNTFSAPKSVSILYGLSKNPGLLEAFRKAVHETRSDMESEVQARIRKGGQNTDRITGNAVCAEFLHFTARPVDGQPDPHLHCHLLFVNATYDVVENQWKAIQYHDPKKHGDYFQAVFLSRLAWNIKEIGFGIEARPNGQWEIAGFDRAFIEKFSRRTTEIEQEAQRRGIKNAKTKAKLGKMTREKKGEEKPLDVLQKNWIRRLSEKEKETISNLDRFSNVQNHCTAEQAFDYALNHHLERQSVIRERKLWTEALKHGVGAVLPQQVKAIEHPELLKGVLNQETFLTTQQVLQEEQKMLELAKNSKGSCFPLNTGKDFAHQLSETTLNQEQKNAVTHLLSSTDRIMSLSGAAGVGKTTLMYQVRKGIEAAGKEVLAVAPSSGATELLTREGFEAITLQKLLMDKTRQEQLRGQVLLMDESGLVSSKQMKQVFDMATQHDVRVILSGDKGQHHAVERGDALALLEKTGSVSSFRLENVVRQADRYKLAMEALSKNELAKGFDTLDQLGWIKECTEKKIHTQIAEEYTRSSGDQKILVVTSTHKEADEVTTQIRKRLTADGKLDSKVEKDWLTLRDLKYTQAQKLDIRNYSPGLGIVFHQRSKGFENGKFYSIQESARNGLYIVTGKGKKIPLPLDLKDSFRVCQPRQKQFCAGDKVRITANGLSKDGHRLINGATYQVKGFSKKGEMILNNGWKLDKDQLHLDFGYVSTSHAAQGATVDKVLVLHSQAGRAVTTREGFYVSASRGRQQCLIYTSDKEDLRQDMYRSAARPSASELAALSVQLSQDVAKKHKLQAKWQFISRVKVAMSQQWNKMRGYSPTKGFSPQLSRLGRQLSQWKGQGGLSQQGNLVYGLQTFKHGTDREI